MQIRAVLRVVLMAAVLRGGTGLAETGYRFALAGYNWDGSLDTSFGNQGKVTTIFPGEGVKGLIGMVVDSKNRIILAGTVGDHMAIVRYHPDGELDETFNGKGILLTDFGS